MYPCDFGDTRCDMVTPALGQSYWQHSAPDGDRSGVALPAEADVVVVGGGITGLTAAYRLTREGRSVVVLEADGLANGVSGFTTAKVSSQHGPKYHQLARLHGPEKAAAYGASQQAALEWIADEHARISVDCEFERKDSYVYVTDPKQAQMMEEEARAAETAGMPAMSIHGDIGLPISPVTGVRFTGQAQFHPRKWLLALADRSESAGCVVAEDARVTQVHGEAGAQVVRTSRGTVHARDVVIATHYPILDRGLFFARLEPIHDLVVAAQVDEPLPGVYFAADSGHSVRTTPLAGGKHLLISLGEHYRTGQDIDVATAFGRLADWTSHWFGVGEPAYRWSAHDMSTPDGLPYIGCYHPGSDHLWVATGFGQWGMTGGTMAGLLLSDLITGADNPWAELYDPTRLFGPRALTSLGKANLEVAKHMVTDHAKAVIRRKRPDELLPGEHTVTTMGTELVAAYRDSDDILHAVSGHCTHLGCVVNFNNADKTWDCPCHASRFAVDGSVLNGPAVKPLEPAKLDSDELDITATAGRNMMPQWLRRLLHLGQEPTKESDVPVDPAVANARPTGGSPERTGGDDPSTTGPGEHEKFVGRASGQDQGYVGRTGAEARSEQERDQQ